MNKPEPKRDDKGVPWCGEWCSAYSFGTMRTKSVCEIDSEEIFAHCPCLPQVQLDEAELAQLRACHEAELGVCQQHCDIVQKSEQEIRRLERLVEKGGLPGLPYDSRRGSY